MNLGTPRPRRGRRPGRRFKALRGRSCQEIQASSASAQRAMEEMPSVKASTDAINVPSRTSVSNHRVQDWSWLFKLGHCRLSGFASRPLS
jgi:hypothetical protein